MQNHKHTIIITTTTTTACRFLKCTQPPKQKIRWAKTQEQTGATPALFFLLLAGHKTRRWGTPLSSPSVIFRPLSFVRRVNRRIQNESRTKGGNEFRLLLGCAVGGSNPPVGPRQSAEDFDTVKGHVGACGRVWAGVLAAVKCKGVEIDQKPKAARAQHNITSKHRHYCVFFNVVGFIPFACEKMRSCVIHIPNLKCD